MVYFKFIDEWVEVLEEGLEEGFGCYGGDGGRGGVVEEVGGEVGVGVDFIVVVVVDIVEYLGDDGIEGFFGGKGGYCRLGVVVGVGRGGSCIVGCRGGWVWCRGRWWLGCSGWRGGIGGWGGNVRLKMVCLSCWG